MGMTAVHRVILALLPPSLLLPHRLRGVPTLTRPQAPQSEKQHSSARMPHKLEQEMVVSSGHNHHLIFQQ